MMRAFAPWKAALVSALVLALVGAGSAVALPRPVTSFLFGSALVRADVVVRAHGDDHLYRVERGRVRAIGLTAIVLRERDGSNVTVPVASDAALTGVRKGRAWRGTLLGLRRGMTVATVQDGEEPAERVHVLRPPALPLPPALLTTLFGDRMARADLVVQVGTAPTLYRLDRGRIRAIGATFIVLRERDGTNQTVAVDDDAVVTGIGRGRLKRGVLAALKRSMVVETVRQGDQPAERIHVVGR